MQLIINVFVVFILYILIAKSVIIPYYTTNFINISHAATITFGAYFTFLSEFYSLRNYFTLEK